MKFDFTAGDRGVVLDEHGNKLEDCISGDTEQGWRIEYVRDSSGTLQMDPKGCGLMKRTVRGRIIFLRASSEQLPMYPPVWPEAS